MFTANFAIQVENTIRGYHKVSNTPIKEAVWENILSQALTRCKCNHISKHGSHESGRDIIIDGCGISCKSAKLTKQSFNVSSYRMTKCHTSDSIIDEIDNVRNNFTYYCILARDDSTNKLTILYSIYVIPSKVVKAAQKPWRSVNDKNGKHQKWITDESFGYCMSVTKSMSNQLWIKFDRDAFEEYRIVQDMNVSTIPVIDYASLLELDGVSS